MSITALSYVKSIAPYQAGKPIDELARDYGLMPKDIVKLASNENPLGMPASAREAVQLALTEGARYPDGNGFELKQTLARRHGVPASWLALGNGSNDILELCASALLAPGTSAVYSEYAFAVYALAIKARGATSIVVPALNFGHNPQTMPVSIVADTRLMYFANPNNPTGTFVTATALEAMLECIPGHVAVVLDEAYNEYVPSSLQYDSLPWVRRFPNVLVSRTFSKAYGLAGLRIGYAIAQPEMIDLLNRVRQPFNVNHLAHAAAKAVLGDASFLAESVRINRAGMMQLVTAFERLGLRYLPSVGNFVLVHVGNATWVYEQLLRRGVIVRLTSNYGLPEWLRVSVGLPDENQRFIEALQQCLASTR